MTSTRVDLPGGGRVHVVATVQGLRDEAERVRAAFRAVAPAAIAIGTSPEGVEGLRHFRKEGWPDPEPAPEPPKPRPEPRRHKDGTLFEEDVEDPYEYDAAEILTESEAAYGLALQRFGEVRLPPRCLLAAVESADDADLPVEGVDFTEEEYGDAFAEHVNAWSLLRYTRRVGRLEKKPPRAESAAEFVLAWDAQVRRVKAIAALEAHREAHMAARVRDFAREHGTILLVVELQRADGVVRALREPPTEGPHSSAT